MSCMYECTANAVQRGFGAILHSRASFPDIEVPEADPRRFVVAFCGSGTGHMTQALTVVRRLEEQGFQLGGVVTDEEADEKMLSEIIRPLGFEPLVLPCVTLIKPETGIVSARQVASNVHRASKEMIKQDGRIRAFFQEARCGVLLNFFHITLAWYLGSHRLPESVSVFAIAAQFAFKDLPVAKLPSLQMVLGKATIDYMGIVFARSARCVPLSAFEREGVIAPIIECPAPVGDETWAKRLVLCYFLTQKDAVRLERLLGKHPVEGVEFHCFSAVELTAPKGRDLSLHSHLKQRKLFKELFERCTGVIVSTGNETIWEAVCRGVPVLTIPTPGHGEQMINSILHAKNHPNLVRARRKLHIDDVRWVASFDTGPACRAESEQLREWSADGGAQRLVSLIGGPPPAEREAAEQIISI